MWVMEVPRTSSQAILGTFTLRIVCGFIGQVVSQAQFSRSHVAAVSKCAGASSTYFATERATDRIPFTEPSRAPPTVPEYVESQPRFGPLLMPLRTRSQSGISS